MIDINELRQLTQAATPGPWINYGRQPNARGVPHSAVAAKTLLARVYSEAYGDFHQETANAAFIAATNPAAISEILDRLEAAEEERDRYKLAYNDWIAKTEWLQHEIARSSLPAKYLGMHRADAIKTEIDRLRAKVEAMERQKPAAFALYSGWARKAVYLSELEACDQRDRRQLTADLSGSLEAYRVVPLYTSPGAKGEDK